MFSWRDLFSASFILVAKLVVVCFIDYFPVWEVFEVCFCPFVVVPSKFCFVFPFPLFLNFLKVLALGLFTATYFTDFTEYQSWYLKCICVPPICRKHRIWCIHSFFTKTCFVPVGCHAVLQHCLF